MDTNNTKSIKKEIMQVIPTKVQNIGKLFCDLQTITDDCFFVLFFFFELVVLESFVAVDLLVDVFLGCLTISVSAYFALASLYLSDSFFVFSSIV